MYSDDINIFYSIKDNRIEKNSFSLEELKNYINYDTILSENDENIDSSNSDDDGIYEKYSYYECYTMKSLFHILDFYKIKHRRLKEHIIQDIISFESNNQNEEIVNERIRLWENIKELKNHNYFKKYIIFDI